MCYFTGARLGDCCRMQWEGVDLGEGTLTFTQTKTGAKVTAPLHPDLLARINKLAETDKPEIFILPGMANLRPGGRHGLSEGFKRIMRKAGLDLQTVKGCGRGLSCPAWRICGPADATAFPKVLNASCGKRAWICRR